MDDRRTSQEVRRVAERAVRRLNVLEYVILGAAAVLALLAGAVAAFLVEAAFGLPFRPSWAVASLALFCIPAAVAYLRERRLERRQAGRMRAKDREADGPESQAGGA